MLEIIRGKPKPDYKMLWLNAYDNALRRCMEPEGQKAENYQRVIFAGVKYMRSTYREYQAHKNIADEVKGRQTHLECIAMHMAMLTPRQFMRLFPVTKEYDGARWGCKDYFSVMEYMRTLDWDKPIGGPETLFSFLWEYQNSDTSGFLVDWMMVIESIMHLHGEDGPMDKLIDSMGLTRYYMEKDEATGREYILNGDTGKTVPVRKSIPRYLKLVSGGGETS